MCHGPAYDVFCTSMMGQPSGPIGHDIDNFDGWANAQHIGNIWLDGFTPWARWKVVCPENLGPANKMTCWRGDIITIYCSGNVTIQTGWSQKPVHIAGNICSQVLQLCECLRALYKSQAIAQMTIRYCGGYTALEYIAPEMQLSGQGEAQSWST
jgi:hypothetical protein